MMITNILILAAGVPGFDSPSGYPICLAEQDGVSLLENIVANTRHISRARYTFAFREKDVERFHLDRVAELLVPGANVLRVNDDTKGSACTTLLAASGFEPDQEVLVISANELVDCDLSEVLTDFRRRGLDSGTLTFKSIHPRYSSVRLNDEGYVVEAAHQRPISNNAAAGIFWFVHAGEMIEAIKNAIRKDARVNGNFYVATALNELILKRRRIGVAPLDTVNYHPLKTAAQVAQYEGGAV